MAAHQSSIWDKQEVGVEILLVSRAFRKVKNILEGIVWSLYISGVIQGLMGWVGKELSAEQNYKI